MRTALVCLAAFLPALLPACGPHAGGRATAGARAPLAPAYDVHEWGVVAVRPGQLEVAAGHGEPAMPFVDVDKPVLYVHAHETAPFEMNVRVVLPPALSVAEVYPPAASDPLGWRVQVETAGCRGSFPTGTARDERCPDGYCERYELGNYETTDASCLGVGDVRTPLLFYRLNGDEATGVTPPLPLAVAVDGDALLVRRQGSLGTLGALIRVSRRGNAVFSRIVELAAQGETRVGAPTESAALGLASMRMALRAQGLTEQEAAAFDRAWSPSIFGAVAGATARDGDTLVADESARDVDRLDDGLPQDEDVLLYWLDAGAIDSFARLELTPPPTHLRRVFMVRYVVR